MVIFMNEFHTFIPGAQDNRFCAHCGDTFPNYSHTAVFVPKTHRNIFKSQSDGSAGKKNDQGKPRMDLLPMDALLEVARVLAFGAKKYGDRNWEKGLDLDRLRAAQMRHDAANVMGESLDAESNLPHIAHKTCNALMELSLFLRGQKASNG